MIKILVSFSICFVLVSGQECIGLCLDGRCPISYTCDGNNCCSDAAEPPNYGPCIFDTECPSGYVCNAGYCSSNDPSSSCIGLCIIGFCPDGFYCDAGKCCSNAPEPPTTCSDILSHCDSVLDLCKYADWKDYLRANCAKTCGFCDQPNSACQEQSDSPIDCALNADKCTQEDWCDVMTQYCPRTCGYCS